jgi:hypothetical protein
MKCVEKANLGIIKRLSDFEAGNLVDNKGWTYCPKWKWKEARGTNKN